MNLSYKSFGQGPALIILHGLFGSLDNWVSHARQLADHFSVYLIDQRNHGKSPHDPVFNYESMAEDLHDFMDQQGIFKAHLLGHSMGGKTVMTFAGHYPERIDKLIVADIAPKAYPPHHQKLIESLNKLPLTELSSRQEADSLLIQGIPESGVRQFLLKSLSRDREDGFRWKFNLQTISAHYEEILKEVSIEPFEGPSLFIHGGKSNYLQSSDKEYILEMFPHAVFEEIPDVGHWLHAEAPAEFLSRISAFLAD